MASEKNNVIFTVITTSPIVKRRHIVQERLHFHLCENKFRVYKRLYYCAIRDKIVLSRTAFSELVDCQLLRLLHVVTRNLELESMRYHIK